MFYAGFGSESENFACIEEIYRSLLLDFSDYEETEKFIMKRFEVSKRELFELKKFYPQKYESWLKELDSQIKSINKE